MKDLDALKKQLTNALDKLEENRKAGKKDYVIAGGKIIAILQDEIADLETKTTTNIDKATD